jgi:dolichol-phosphate mannosyltransferase
LIQDKRIAVVVPCYNEETQILRVLTTMPVEVDRVYVIDDASPDGTARVIHDYQPQDSRVQLIVHPNNQGVGGAIATGYKAALADGWTAPWSWPGTPRWTPPISGPSASQS